MYKGKTTGNAIGIQVKFCGLAVTLLLKRKRRRDFLKKKREEGKKDERDKEGKKQKREKASNGMYFGSCLELLCLSLLLGLFRSLRLHKSFIPLFLGRRRATYISQKCQEEQRTVTTEGCSFWWPTEETWLLSQWNSKKDAAHRSPGKQFYSAERSPCD